MDNSTQKLLAVMIVIVTILLLLMAITSVREKRMEQRLATQQEMSEIKTMITIIGEDNKQTDVEITQLQDSMTDANKRMNIISAYIYEVESKIPKLDKIGDCILLESDDGQRHIIC